MSENECGCGSSAAQEQKSLCCGPEPVAQKPAAEGCACSPSTEASCCPPRELKAPWIIGKASTPAGELPIISTQLNFSDTIGSWKSRWGIGRMSYSVPPGLYAVGSPTAESPVFVSANYKMSFDVLRSSIHGIDAWLLVIDTKGINVWCAAGKKTFGTDEIVRRVKAVSLEKVVSHKKLIVPQLGAPGVSAHQVREKSGFRVVYGPVRAQDIPEYMRAGMKATPEMRRVRFPMLSRVSLAPVEIVFSAKYFFWAAAAFTLLSGFGAGIFSVENVVARAPLAIALLAAAYISGTTLTPALLPYLPATTFSGKGAIAGAITFAVFAPLLALIGAPGRNAPELAALFLIVASLSSFLGMNFTGSSTYTSFSGVKKEMQKAIPVQIVSFAIGTILWIGAAFLK